MTEPAVSHGENFKNFVSARDAAERLSYTTDYVSRLAREGKVEAIRDGRQWLVDLDSLKLFSLQAEAQRREFNERVRSERRLERVRANLKAGELSRSAKASTEAVSALLESTAVTLCIVLVFVIGLYSRGSGIEPAHLAEGVENMTRRVSTSFGFHGSTGQLGELENKIVASRQNLNELPSSLALTGQAAAVISSGNILSDIWCGIKLLWNKNDACLNIPTTDYAIVVPRDEPASQSEGADVTKETAVSSITYVTNEYFTNPVTVVEKEAVDAIEKEVVVVKEFIEVQTDATHNSIDSLARGLGESFNTQTLTVSGGTTLSGSLNGTSASFTSLALTGPLSDSTTSSGTDGYVLQSTGTSTLWVATSSLGISGGGITSLNGLSGASQTFATSTSGGIDLIVTSSGTTHTFTANPTTGYSIPLTASTTAWEAFYDVPSSIITAGGNLAWSGNTLGVAAGYNIPLTASTTEWNGFLRVPSTVITAGDGIDWSSNTLNVNDVTAAMLASADFGDFTCNGTTCSFDSSTVASSTLNISNWTNGYVLQASTTASTGFDWVATSTLGISSGGGGFDTAGTGLTSTGTTVNAIGGVGITANANDLAFDATEIDAVTWSDGANASNIWTFDVSGTDTTATWGSDLLTLSGSLTLGTGKNFTIGSTQWNSGDSIDGEQIANDTIDDDSIDFVDVTLADLTFDVGSVDTTEFGYLNGVTSAIQTQLDGKLTTSLTDGYIFAGNNSNIATATSSIYIADGGNVGIGTTSPITKLDVWGNLNVATGSTPALYVDTVNNRVGVRTDAPADTLDVDGDILISRSDSTTAGIRLTGSDGRTFRFSNFGTTGITGTGGIVVSKDAPYSTARFGAYNGNQTTTYFLLFDDAVANTMALRNGTNAQRFSIYNTYTSSTDLERAGLYWSGNVFNIDTEAGGSGTDRDLALQKGGGSVSIGTTTSTARLTIQATSTDDILNLIETGGNEVVTVLESGSVGIGTTTPARLLSVAGNAIITGALYDNADSAGSNGYVLQSSGSGFSWAATSTLGFSALGATINVTELASEDFGDFTCNGAACSLDADTVSDSEIDYATVTLADLTFDVGSVDTTEFGYLNGVTSAIQTQFTGKLSTSLTDGYIFAGNNSNIAVATSSIFLYDNGNVGIGTTSPEKKLTVFDTISDDQFRISYDATRYADFQVDSNGDLVVDAQGGDVRLNDESLYICASGSCPGNDTPSGTGDLIVENEFSVGTTTPRSGYQAEVWGDLYVASGNVASKGLSTSTIQGDLSIFGKLDVSTIDPVYRIDGIKYATYGISSIGIKEETTDTISVDEFSEESGYYEKLITWSELQKGSDLWLFYQVTDFGVLWENLTVSLTPGFDGRVFYTKDIENNALLIQSTAPGEVSARLIADRFDSAKWSNLRDDQDDPFTHFDLQSKP